MMPLDTASGISREDVGPAASVRIEGRINRLVAEATRVRPRAPHEELWVGDRISNAELQAVERLLAGCEIIALGIGGDQRDLARCSEDNPHDPLEVEYDRALHIVGGDDAEASLIRGTPDLAQYEWRALNRAHARGRVERALAAVGLDGYRLLRFLVNDATDAALATEAGIPQSTMRDRLVSAIRTLTRHYEREDRRKLILPPTRATAPAEAVAEHYASTGPGGPAPAPVKRPVLFMDLMPSVLGDYAEAAEALIEVDRLQRLVLGENWLAEYLAKVNAVLEGRSTNL